MWLGGRLHRGWPGRGALWGGVRRGVLRGCLGRRLLLLGLKGLLLRAWMSWGVLHARLGRGGLVRGGGGVLGECSGGWAWCSILAGRGLGYGGWGSAGVLPGSGLEGVIKVPLLAGGGLSLLCGGRGSCLRLLGGAADPAVAASLL